MCDDVLIVQRKFKPQP